MEEFKRNPLPEMECGMAYLAHPTLPNLTIISPLHAYSFLEGKNMEETEILRYDFRLLNNCTLLILSGYWRQSKGCMSEYGYAKAKGIRIYEYRDNLLYPLE